MPRTARRTTAAPAASAAYPSLSEQEKAVEALIASLSGSDVDYFARRAEEHRRLGYESAEHRAANAHHLLASLYEALVAREADPAPLVGAGLGTVIG